MTQTQKIIKYFAIALAFLIIFSIFSSIFGFINTLTMKKEKDRKIESIFNSDYANVAYLDIDVKAVDLVIKTGNNLIVETNNKYINCKQNSNKLIIKERKRSSWSKNNNKLIITIPENIEFDAFRLDAGAGKIDIDQINSKKADINLDTGKATINVLNATDKLKLDTGVGKLEILNGIINNLDLDMGVGKVSINSKLVGKSKIEAGIGTLRINLLDKKDNYSIEVSKGLGTISLNEKKLNEGTYGNSSNEINIDGGIGNIDITTTER